MVCSCAYYENVSENLEQSQRNKFDHIYRPLCDTKKTRIFHFQRNGMVWALLVQNGLTVFSILSSTTPYTVIIYKILPFYVGIY